jgi:hypothetical protein
MFVSGVHEQFVEMRDLFLFLIFLFAVSKLEDGLLELVEDATGKG